MTKFYAFDKNDKSKRCEKRIQIYMHCQLNKIYIFFPVATIVLHTLLFRIHTT